MIGRISDGLRHFPPQGWHLCLRNVPGTAGLSGPAVSWG
ncbi:hypothetical protein BV133_545 [Blastochloris viridis]|uniref:Uncharacterized protein n=1 Tax=Blastochloris viridis TaxID=1079 RepID=A0A182CYI9_BLAVI|nr:hypothetical protein BV133_545 [Blastochloris viridis]